MLELKILYVLFFIFAIIIDYAIKKNVLGDNIKHIYLRFTGLNYVIISFTLFILLWLLFTLLSSLDLNLLVFLNDGYFDTDFFKKMSDNNVSSNNNLENGSNTNTMAPPHINLNPSISGQVNDNTVNVNTPVFNFSMSKEGTNNLAAAASSAGGASVGLKVAKSVSGSPALKIAGGLGYMGAVQIGTAIMFKILSNNNDSDDNTTKFLPKLFNDDISTVLNDKYPNFPLNLLSEMNRLVNVEILFLMIMLNIFIVNKLISIDYVSYLPKNKLGHFLEKAITRYIKIWSKSSIFLIILSWVSLFSCVLLSKICFIFIQ